jgi:hypothetical protein
MTLSVLCRICPQIILSSRSAAVRASSVMGASSEPPGRESELVGAAGSSLMTYPPSNVIMC